MADDRLGAVAVSLVVSELHWTPDVAPAVMDRISRDAVAYPEHFDRRPLSPPPYPFLPPPSERSAQRTIGRIAVFAVIIAVVVALVVFAASTSGSEASLAAERLISLVTEVA
jgi:hypothetical protein